MRPLPPRPWASAPTERGALSDPAAELTAKRPRRPRLRRRLATLAGVLPVLVAQGASLALVYALIEHEAAARHPGLLALLAAVTGVGLLLAGAASLWTARQVATPLLDLAQASLLLCRGDYQQPTPHTARGDEVGTLARAFDHLRCSIATQQRDIHRLAYTDHLTGLPNRARFRQAVADAIGAATGSGRPLAVVLLDLDRFKQVNEVLGHTFGDRLLKAVAERLGSQAAQHGHRVARLSDDEFGLLLCGVDVEGALDVAQRTGDVLQIPLTLDDHTVDLSAGFGVACWPQHAADADTLINRAEVALYSAKRRRHATVLYDATLDAGSAQTLSLLGELRRALEQGELRLFLQPRIALTGWRAGQLVGAEALIRWQHPTQGLVPPLQFIPLAEQTGLVRELTLWVFEAAVQHWHELAALGVQRMAVNLSARDLLDQALPAKLEQILANHGVPATALCLEFTETAIMNAPKRARATLDTLRQHGFQISIDDFGTGFSSLTRLQRLPVSELKIDRRFVLDMERHEGNAQIVRSIIGLAHTLGLAVVAEGVENAGVLARLADLHCDEAQGFHINRPVPAAEMMVFAARWAARAEAVVH